MSQFNTTQHNAMSQFNATEKNRQAAINAGNTLQASSLTAQLEADLVKFNEQADLQRDQWNAANAQAVEQSNINWRRSANTALTASTNAANSQNIQNAYNVSAQDQAQLWQELRDDASYIRLAYENKEQRQMQLLVSAIGNEASGKGRTKTDKLIELVSKYF